MVKSSDNIIFAETAAVDNLCLVTRNIEDFKNINITILNPFDWLNSLINTPAAPLGQLLQAISYPDNIIDPQFYCNIANKIASLLITKTFAYSVSRMGGEMYN